MADTLDAPTYVAAAWHWYVAERDAYYSSATGTWSEDEPEHFTTLATVAELISVLERAGCPERAPLNANHVRRECQRRMIAMIGARDAADLAVKLSNAQREAIRLLRKGAENWTPAEATRAAQLEGADAAIELLRSRSNAMEGDPPADYAANNRWE